MASGGSNVIKPGLDKNVYDTIDSSLGWPLRFHDFRSLVVFLLMSGTKNDTVIMVDKVVVSLVWPIHFHPRGFVSLTSEID